MKALGLVEALIFGEDGAMTRRAEYRAAVRLRAARMERRSVLLAIVAVVALIVSSCGGGRIVITRWNPGPDGGERRVSNVTISLPSGLSTARAAVVVEPGVDLSARVPAGLHREGPATRIAVTDGDVQGRARLTFVAKSVHSDEVLVAGVASSNGKPLKLVAGETHPGAQTVAVETDHLSIWQALSWSWRTAVTRSFETVLGQSIRIPPPLECASPAAQIVTTPGATEDAHLSLCPRMYDGSTAVIDARNRRRETVTMTIPTGWSANSDLPGSLNERIAQLASFGMLVLPSGATVTLRGPLSGGSRVGFTASRDGASFALDVLFTGVSMLAVMSGSKSGDPVRAGINLLDDAHDQGACIWDAIAQNVDRPLDLAVVGEVAETVYKCLGQLLAGTTFAHLKGVIDTLASLIRVSIGSITGIRDLLTGAFETPAIIASTAPPPGPPCILDALHQADRNAGFSGVPQPGWSQQKLRCADGWAAVEEIPPPGLQIDGSTSIYRAEGDHWVYVNNGTAFYEECDSGDIPPALGVC